MASLFSTLVGIHNMHCYDVTSIHNINGKGHKIETGCYSFICGQIWEKTDHNVTIDISRNTDLKY